MRFFMNSIDSLRENPKNLEDKFLAYLMQIAILLLYMKSEPLLRIITSYLYILETTFTLSMFKVNSSDKTCAYIGID